MHLLSVLAGLVTLDEMRAKQEDVVKERERQIAIAKGEAHLKNASEALTRLRQSNHKQKVALSFDPNEDEEAIDADDDAYANEKAYFSKVENITSTSKQVEGLIKFNILATYKCVAYAYFESISRFHQVSTMFYLYAEHKFIYSIGHSFNCYLFGCRYELIGCSWN